MMHKKGKDLETIIVVIVFVVIGLSIFVLADSTKTQTGFYWPTGSSNTKITAGFRDTYADLEGVTYDHLGTDWTMVLGGKVYAIADGIVLYVSTGGWGEPGSDNVALLVLHETADGIKFIAIYGHIRTKYEKGDKVFAGKEVGTIGPWSGGTHLHFGIYLSNQLPSGNFGRVVLGEEVDPKFEDPVKFLTAKYPRGKIDIKVDKPILEKPIKLPKTGPAIVDYKVEKYWEIKWAHGAPEATGITTDGNNLYVGTRNGLHFFYPDGTSFGFFEGMEQNGNYFPTVCIDSLQFQNNHLYYFVTWSGVPAGLYTYNYSNTSFNLLIPWNNNFFSTGTTLKFVLDKAGNIYTMQSSYIHNVRIQKFSPSGNLISRKEIEFEKCYGRQGHDIAINSTGKIFMPVSASYQENGDCVLVLSGSNFSFHKISLQKKDTGIEKPISIYIDSADYIYVGWSVEKNSKTTGFFQKYSPTLQFIGEWETGVPVRGMCMDLAGNIYILSDSWIVKFLPK